MCSSDLLPAGGVCAACSPALWRKPCGRASGKVARFFHSRIKSKAIQMTLAKMAIALAACAAMQMANAQSTQNVLLISTNETTGGTPLYLNAIRAAYEAAGATVEDWRGVLNDTTAAGPPARRDSFQPTR